MQWARQVRHLTLAHFFCCFCTSNATSHEQDTCPVSAVFRSNFNSVEQCELLHRCQTGRFPVDNTRHVFCASLYNNVVLRARYHRPEVLHSPLDKPHGRLPDPRLSLGRPKRPGTDRPTTSLSLMSRCSVPGSRQEDNSSTQEVARPCIYHFTSWHKSHL